MARRDFSTQKNLRNSYKQEQNRRRPGKSEAYRKETGQTTPASEFCSSAIHSRRCKNSALCGVGQAITTISCSICHWKGITFANMGISLCKSQNPAGSTGFSASLHLKTQPHSPTSLRPLGTHPQGAETVHFHCAFVQHVENLSPSPGLVSPASFIPHPRPL